MDIIDALKSLGEPTRLRIMALLTHGELSVGELVDILGMSQPRLSRHLNILTASGLIERLPEGAWVFYRLPALGTARQLIDALSPFTPAGQPEFRRDFEQLKIIKARRRSAAEDYFNRTAENWDDVRAEHYPSDAVEAALVKYVEGQNIDFLVDFGTGTGRMLTLFADKARRIEGIDLSHKMLTIARANLERDGIANASVRQGDATAPPFEEDAADLVIIHQVLHYMDAPERVIFEAKRILKPGGRLLVVDFSSHTHEFLRLNHEHRHLGFSDREMHSWMSSAGLSSQDPTTIAPIDEGGINVKIWSADKLASIKESAA